MHNAIWDEKHLKALLRLPRYPLRLIQQEPWESWIEARGGMAAIIDFLNRCVLPQNQRDLLTMILAHPEASVQFYSSKLSVSPRTYDNHLKDLMVFLLPYLNALQAPTLHCSPAASTPQLINLPAPLTSLISTEQVVDDIVAMFRRPDVRLLTITGPGGVGKTRVAIEAARNLVNDFPDGVGFVSLVAVSDPALIAAEIVHALNMNQSREQTAQDVLKSCWWGRRFLLVLDSFEHLMSAAPDLINLLQMIPELKIMVTSREPLNLYGEYCFAVPLLGVPDITQAETFEQRKQYPAVRLFVERARAVRPEFTLDERNITLIADICHALDGLPLAIELAAFCIKWFSLDQICERLQHTLELLGEGPLGLPLRHRTLRNAIDWSYSLLNVDEQALFRRVSVFESWGMDAVEAIYPHADVDMLARAIANKNLIQVSATSNDTRFTMLRTVREYAQEQLDAHREKDQVYRLRTHYYINLAEMAEHESGTLRQFFWASRIKKEYENLRSVLEWTFVVEEFDAAFRLLGALRRYWQQYALLEIQHWIDLALVRGQHIATDARAKTLCGAGWLLIYQGKIAQAQERFGEGFQLAETLGAERLIGLTRQGLGDILRDQGQYDEAWRAFEANVALFRRLHDYEGTAWTFDHLGRVAFEQEDYDKAQGFFDESISIFRRMGNSGGVAVALDHLGRIALKKGHYERALALFEESLAFTRQQPYQWGGAWTLEALSNTLMAQGELDRAEALLRQSLNFYNNIQNTGGMLIVLEDITTLWIARADYQRVVQLGAALQTLDRANQSVLPCPNQVRLQNTLEAACQHLDSAAFAKIWAAGVTMSLEEAVSFTLIE